MQKNIKFKNTKINIDKTWNAFLSQRTKGCISDIQHKIGDNFTPSPENVFRFFTSDLSDLKVVILGQDPYPQPGVATGRAFEVGNIKDWSELKKNTSLQNILKLIYKNHFKKREMPSIDEIRKSIKENKFKIDPPSALFQNWEQQGVVLLNTALTCEINKPNSHATHWSCFIQKVIDYLAHHAPEARWLLWGNNAKKFGLPIDDSKKYESAHPRLNSKKKGSFFFENHFGLNLGVDWLGGI